MQTVPDVSSGLAAAGRAMQGAAEVADKIDLRDAQTQAEEADIAISTEWLKWDAENRRKFQGNQADGYEPAANEWWKKTAETYGKSLSPRARLLASGALQRKQGSAMASVIQFAGAEKERHAREVTAANIANTIQFGVSTGDVAGAADQVRGQIARIGARENWDTAQVQAKTLEALSALHLAHISKLAEQSADAAQAYYQANKGEVAAVNQPRVEEVLRNEGDNQFAKQEAARLAALPLEQQLAEAAKAPPGRREKLITEIRNNHAMVKEAQREREAKFSDQAWQLYAQNKKIPETVLIGMDGKERAQLADAIDARAKRRATGESVKTDSRVYVDLRSRLLAGEKIDLRGYTEKIALPQMEQLLDIQSTLAKPGKDSKRDSMITDSKRIDMALDGLGIDPKKAPEVASRVIGEIERRVNAASAAKGDKELTPDEKQKIVDSVATDLVYVDEIGRDPQKPRSTLAPGEEDKAYVTVDGRNVMVSAVPAADRRQITRALEAEGMPVTEQNIVTYYLRGRKQAQPQPGKAAPVPTASPVRAPSAGAVGAARDVPLTLGTPISAPLKQPGVYASPEEWAAYRKQQQGSK